MNMQPEDLMDMISEHRRKMKGVEVYRDFIKGNCPISAKVAGSFGGASNKVPVNFAQKIKDNISGYFFGIPFQISHSKSEEINEFFNEMFTYNNKDYLITELGSELLDTGKAYWLLYIDKNNYLKILPVPVEEMIVISDRSETDTIKQAIRYYYMDDKETGRVRLSVEVYTNTEVYFLIENNRGRLDFDYSRKVNPVKHIFGHVPVIEFLNNNSTSEYKDIYELSNLYNRLFNAGADETEDIRNVYLRAVNTLISNEALEKIAKTRIIQYDSDKEEPAEVSFLSKNANNGSFENYLALVRSLIFEIACVPDTSTLTQKTQEVSARAMKQLLRELENKCIVKERNIVNSLYRFLRIIRRYTMLKINEDYSISDFDIQFARNTPTTLTLESIDDFVKLQKTNLFSDETLLSFLPFVRNPQIIIDKRDEQHKRDMGVDYENNHE